MSIELSVARAKACTARGPRHGFGEPTSRLAGSPVACPAAKSCRGRSACTRRGRGMHRRYRQSMQLVPVVGREVKLASHMPYVSPTGPGIHKDWLLTAGQACSWPGLPAQARHAEGQTDRPRPDVQQARLTSQARPGVQQARLTGQARRAEGQTDRPRPDMQQARLTGQARRAAGQADWPGQRGQACQGQTSRRSSPDQAHH
eukprot:355182-Chlamydomonas_euryale.AAC.2